MVRIMNTIQLNYTCTLLYYYTILCHTPIHVLLYSTQMYYIIHILYTYTHVYTYDRYAQEPLVEYCNLWTSCDAVEVFGYEALYLDLHPLKVS